MKALIIDNHSKYIEAIRSYLKDYEISVKSYLEINSEDKNNFDLFILSGGYGRSRVNSDPKVNFQEIDLVRKTMSPVIGICYGCQLIAESYESRIEELPEKVIANKEIVFIKDFLDKKKGDKIVVHEEHHFAIKELGEDLEAYAMSDNGFEIIKHKQKQLFGFQFHPERFPELTLGDELFSKLLKNL
ncbi:MAG: glutamine amidotransferase-related protein [Candidatus Dojkabacteria bacterium]